MKNFIRNPKGHNQWVLRTNEEMQTIDKHLTADQKILEVKES